jgi:hypothetical protein
VVTLEGKKRPVIFLMANLRHFRHLSAFEALYFFDCLELGCACGICMIDLATIIPAFQKRIGFLIH